MLHLRRHRHLLARLAALVMLLAALAPTLSRGLAAVQGDMAPWAQLCSASDPSVAGASGSAGDGALHLLQHCALCHLAGDAPALPATHNALGLALPVVRDGLPVLAGQAPRRLHAWAAPPGRAPPLRA